MDSAVVYNWDGRYYDWMDGAVRWGYNWVMGVFTDRILLLSNYSMLYKLYLYSMELFDKSKDGLTSL